MSGGVGASFGAGVVGGKSESASTFGGQSGNAGGNIGPLGYERNYTPTTAYIDSSGKELSDANMSSDSSCTSPSSDPEEVTEYRHTGTTLGLGLGGPLGGYMTRGATGILPLLH